MTPAESCGLDGVSVTSAHHVSESRQWLVLSARYPQNAICPNPQLPLRRPNMHCSQTKVAKIGGWAGGEEEEEASDD